MSDLMSQCQDNMTKLLGQLKRVFNQQQSLVKRGYKRVVCRVNTNTPKQHHTSTCERGDLEIHLTIVKDKCGKLLLPSHKATLRVDDDQYLTSPIGPIPTPNKLRVTSTIKVTTRLPSGVKVQKIITSSHKHLNRSERRSQLDGVKMDLSDHLCSESYVDSPEAPRLDYKHSPHVNLEDSISCEVIKGREGTLSRGREDTLSSCDSGYEHSDVDEGVCRTRPASSLSQDTDVVLCDSSTPTQVNNPCLLTPLHFNTTIINHFNIPLEHSTDLSHYDDHSVIQTLECDMTGFSYSASMDTNNVTVQQTDHKLTTTTQLNVTDLESEITQALRKSLLEELSESEEGSEGNQATEDQSEATNDQGEAAGNQNEAEQTQTEAVANQSEATLNQNELLVSRTISVTTEVLCEEMESHESQILQQIDRRKDELHRMVDNWHRWITHQVQGSYQKEQRRLNIEAARDCVVPGVSSPLKTMSTFLNTTEKLSGDMFGTFHCNTVYRQSPSQNRVNNYFLSDTEHVRTFETRDTDMDTDYMATGLDIDKHGNYTVTDLGADTCRIFSSTGRLLTDLDISPLDEPTYAISDIVTDNTILACRTGLKCYSSRHSLTLAKHDVKCPQCVSMDSVGNYVVSDMHDCGSVIVTIERDTLLPLRMFCGTQYDDYPQSFTRAWYIHVTASGAIVLSDRDDHMVKCYSAHGEFLWSVGGLGAQPGKFFTPAGITQDRLGNLLVADSQNNRVQILSPTGDWLGVVISNHTDEAFKCPVDVAIDNDGHLAVLLASGTVSIYSYLQ